MGINVYTNFGNFIQTEAIDLVYSPLYLTAQPAVGFKLKNNDAAVTTFKPFFVHESQTTPISQSFVRFRLGNSLVDNMRVGLHGYDTASNQLVEVYELDLSNIDVDADNISDIIYRYTTGSTLNDSSLGDIANAQAAQQSNGISIPYSVYLPRSADNYYAIAVSTSSVDFYYNDLTTPVKTISRSFSDGALSFYASIPQGGEIEEVSYGPYDTTAPPDPSQLGYRPEPKSIGVPWAFAQRFDINGQPTPTNQYTQGTHVQLAYASTASFGGATGSQPPPQQAAAAYNTAFVPKLDSSQGYKYSNAKLPGAYGWGTRPITYNTVVGVGKYLDLSIIYPNLFNGIDDNRNMLEMYASPSGAFGSSNYTYTTPAYTSTPSNNGALPSNAVANRLQAVLATSGGQFVPIDSSSAPPDFTDKAYNYPWEVMDPTQFGSSAGALEQYKLIFKVGVERQYNPLVPGGLGGTWVLEDEFYYFTVMPPQSLPDVITAYNNIINGLTAPQHWTGGDMSIPSGPMTYDPNTGQYTQIEIQIPTYVATRLRYTYIFSRSIPAFFTKGTYSHVEMEGVTSLGNEYTPAVIVCNNAKTIYYFLYSRKDNRYNPAYGVEVSCEEEGELLKIEPFLEP